VAREDTMFTSVPEVLVSAPRVTLDEILDRVARGEARRESLMTDESFRATLRIVRGESRGKPAELIQETVTQVYRKRVGKVRAVTLRNWQAHPNPKNSEKGSAEVTFGPSMGEDMVNFAFQPSARRDFKYRIAGRDLVGNHLIYRIGFSPRSMLDPSTPSGLVWIDTNDFVIVRQEVWFDRSPMPLILKAVARMVVERERVGSAWVVKRVLARAETTIPLPRLGQRFDFAIDYDDYAINSGLSDSLFINHVARPAAVRAGAGR
jgi:hypothetical protein